jgi:hypothetical protein
MGDADKMKQMRGLLSEALAWLDDYGMRMSGTADLADRIRNEIEQADEDSPNMLLDRSADDKKGE